MDSGRRLCQRHQILTIGADVHRVVVNRALTPLNGPLQRTSSKRCGERHTIVDAGFNLRALFVIVPGHQL